MCVLEERVNDIEPAALPTGCLMMGWTSCLYVLLAVTFMSPFLLSHPLDDSLLGLVVKASASRVADLGFDSRLSRDFSGSNHTSDFFFFFFWSKMALQWLPCQAPGGLGSALVLVGPMSVYCELMS